MSQSNILSDTLKFVTVKLIGQFLYFPIWWYTKGLLEKIRSTGRGIADASRRGAVIIWLKNMFVPMYGTTDIWSRIISFVMRVILLIGKLIMFFIWVVIYLAGLAVYILLPIFIIFMLLRSLSFF